MNNKFKSLIKDTIIFGIGNLGSKVILFLLVPLYTNFLSTAEYGTADLVSTFSQLIIPFASLSINDAVIRFALKKDERPENVIKTAFCTFVITFIVTAATLPLLGLYNAIAQWKWYLAVQILLTSVSETEKAYLKAKNKNEFFTIISILQTLVLAVTNVVLLSSLHLGVKGYLSANNIALLFASILGFILGGLYKDLKIGEFDFALFKRMASFSIPLIFNNISWWVIHSSDKIMIEAMIGAGMLGLYTAATKIPSLINVIISIFTQAWGISSIREIEGDNNSTFFATVFNMYSTITFGAGIFFNSIIKYFMVIYVGEAFRESWKLTPLLLSAAVFYAVSSYYGSIYSAIQKTVNSMVTTIICAITNVIINFIFINIVGVWGAIIGTVSSYFVIAHIRMIDINRFINISIDYKKYMFNCFLLLAQAILITINFYVTFVSFITITCFVIINRKEIKLIVNGFVRHIRR